MTTRFEHYFDREAAREISHRLRELAPLAEIAVHECLAQDSLEPLEAFKARVLANAFGVRETVLGLLERLEAKEAAAQRHAERIESMRISNERRIEKALAAVLPPIANGSAEIIDPAHYAGFFVYLIWGDDPEKPIYVGQSRSILSRISSHLNDPLKRAHIRRFQLIRFRTQSEMDRAEMQLIRHHRPRFNRAGVPLDEVAL